MKPRVSRIQPYRSGGGYRWCVGVQKQRGVWENSVHFFNTWREAYDWALKFARSVTTCQCGLGTLAQCRTETWGCFHDPLSLSV